MNEQPTATVPPITAGNPPAPTSHASDADNPPASTSHASDAVSLPVPPSDLASAGNLLPTLGNFPIETVHYQRVVLHAPAVAATELTSLDTDGAVDPLKPKRAHAYTRPAFGARLTIQQDWTARGLTLGQLLHAVSLAPGEVTRIAVIDWTRRASGSQQDDTSQLEDLSTVGDQARAVSEVSNAVAHELQSGGSQTTSKASSGQLGVSGAIGSWLGFSAGGSTNDAVATTVATTDGTKSVAADTLQHVQARTQQHATASRGRRAAVVTETSQSEHEVASTRILANYNHMHALTMQYYEVLQVYEVSARVARVEPLLFVPLKPVSFDYARINSYRSVLVAAAARLEAQGMPGAAGMAAAIDACGLASKVLAPASTAASVQAWPAVVQPKSPEPPLPLRPDVEGALLMGFTIESPPDSLLCGFEIPGLSARVSDADKDTKYYEMYLKGLFTMDLIEQPQGLGVMAKARPLDASFSFSVVYRRAASNRRPAKITLRVKLADGRNITLEQTFVPPPASTGSGDGFDTYPVCLVQDLGEERLKRVCAHLNRNALYYSVAVWEAEGCSLAAALSGYSYGGKPLLSCVDPKPVASVDNLMAFRIVDAKLAQASDTMKHLDDPTDKAAKLPRLIAMPTGGVFGEAVLGQSNAAEKLDITRFWHWQDSPIPVLPPEIAALSMGSRARDMPMATDRLEQGAAQFVPLQNMPDPTGLQETAKALMTRIFDDMSNASANAQTAREALDKASSGADAASGKSLEAYKAALEHQIEMMKMAVDAAKTLAPLVVPEAAAAGAAGKLAESGLSGGGSGGGGGASLSKIGGVLNAAESGDAKRDAGPTLRKAVGELVGGSAAAGKGDDAATPEAPAAAKSAQKPEDSKEKATTEKATAEKATTEKATAGKATTGKAAEEKPAGAAPAAPAAPDKPPSGD